LSSIDTISSGSVIVDGYNITQLKNKQLAQFRKTSLGFIFQYYSVLPTLTVKENIMLPLSVQQHNKKEMEQHYKEVTDALGIYDLSQKYPNEIS
ncbi:ATP-binding cassette domain-containing protein, partial [Staphylococcus capitis]